GLRIACCVSRQRLADWDWLKWLPHTADRTHQDAAGPARLCAGSLTELAALLADDLGEREPFTGDQGVDQDGPFIVVILAGGDRHPHPALDVTEGRVGVTFVDLSSRGTPAGPSTLDLVVDGGRLGRRRPESVASLGAPDHLDGPAAEFVARQLAA